MAVFDVELAHGRTQDVAGVCESQTECGRKLVPVGTFERLEQLDRSADVVFAVERLDGRTVAADVARVESRQVASVFLLDVQAVAEHDGRQVGGRRRAIDGPAKPGSKQPGEIAAMVDVGVRKDRRRRARAASQRKCRFLVYVSARCPWNRPQSRSSPQNYRSRADVDCP